MISYVLNWGGDGWLLLHPSPQDFPWIVDQTGSFFNPASPEKGGFGVGKDGRDGRRRLLLMADPGFGASLLSPRTVFAGCCFVCLLQRALCVCCRESIDVPGVCQAKRDKSGHWSNYSSTLKVD